MYSKCGEVYESVKVFDEMPVRDTVSWNSMIWGFLGIGDLTMGFGGFRRMYDSGMYRIDQATLTTVLSACDNVDMVCVCEMIHLVVIRNGYERETSVGNALITSYFKCGSEDSGKRVFGEMGFGVNVITWTAVISGFAQGQLYEESLGLYLEMRAGFVEPNSLTYASSLLACSGLRALREGHKIHCLILKSGFQLDLCVESALMDMYSKCGSMEDACCIFDGAEELDDISLTVILVGFAQNGLEEEAIKIFVKMVKANITIDSNVVSAILGVFGDDGSLGLGMQIHSLVIKKRLCSNTFVSNGLINMYSKCGNLEDSVKVFYLTTQKNFVSWNSMIAAFARHGNGFNALQLYENMRLEGVDPTDVTFLSLLHACSHIGLIGKGIELLESMSKVHGISPRTEHFACVVDMLGRAGRLNEAKIFIYGLSVEPGVLVWQALLGACSMHGDSQVGKYAADKLLLAAPESISAYVLMANIYSSERRWEERSEVIKKMKEVGVKKDTGMSWIEIDKKVHTFVVEDTFHSQGEIIYGLLEELYKSMKDEG
ncbi:hypothetical protein GIB67_025535 [Kingdonia uniflora]|uniref:Pentatricopeptide repeat-containing protein n=1 Tax=Kingdonia uniflora TaxID=39325 RepID=A0A7J7M096_9MAGN|nr:hypothetical protein GIB67_025535 [Kingdonia uniflora]